MDYLVFRLYGPMASWGDIAIGESRHSHNGPTKSAVMGLVAAALGIRREEEATHLALNQAYSMATAVLRKGQFLRDYHTVQAPDSAGKFRYRTRRDELVTGRERLGTVLSSREYRTDAMAWVALAASEQAPFSLEQLAEALNQPKFLLYLGRKSCPLAAPVCPQLIQAEDFQGAFQQYQPLRMMFVSGNEEQQKALQQRFLAADKQLEFNWEGELEDFCCDGSVDTQSLMTVVVHDQLRSRERWQFSPRKVMRLNIMEDQ
jgi:CRISPR system Cascade subunit CasD